MANNIGSMNSTDMVNNTGSVNSTGMVERIGTEDMIHNSYT
jgi:hypothetical protein